MFSTLWKYDTHSYKTSYLRDPIQTTMAQDPQAQAIRKRKATIKIAKRKAQAEAAAQAAPTKTKKAEA